MQKKIIIRTPNFIGDTIMMLPALELVRTEFPDAEITIVCKSASVDVFRDKGISDIIVDDTKGKGRLKRTLQFVKQLRRKKYDLGILFHNSFLTALLFRLVKIKTLIGYEKEGRKFLLDFHLPIDRNWHYSNHYANLVNLYLSNKYEMLPKMKLHCEPSMLVEKSEKPLVGFVLGEDVLKSEDFVKEYATRIKKGSRKYPKELGVNLFEELSQKEYDFVFLGDKQDCQNHNLYGEIVAKNHKKHIDLTGKTSVEEFIDAIASLDLLITIDSAAMHIASAVGTEFVALVGKGTSPFSVVFPKDGKRHVLDKGQDRLRGDEMIKAILPEDIFQKVVEIVDKKVNFDGKSFL